MSCSPRLHGLILIQTKQMYFLFNEENLSLTRSDMLDCYWLEKLDDLTGEETEMWAEIGFVSSLNKNPGLNVYVV